MADPRKLRVLPSLALAALTVCAAPAAAQEAPRWSLAIHGGAGVIERDALTPQQDAAYRAALSTALDAGSAVLAQGGSAVDAVEAAIRTMEDDPLFNAGRGAVFTAAGRNEMDAALMDGSDLTAGSVAGLTRTRHPISAARAVRDRSPHVMLMGEGADAFAASAGLEQVEPSWFFTERRWQGLLRTLRERGLPLPDRPAGAPPVPDAQAALMVQPGAPPLNERKFGTVGAVALDAQGRLAAGTSTGGTNAKQWGRVGDAPIIGAGTYASDADGCAVSATGDGEFYIRATVARDICAQVRAINAVKAEQLAAALAQASAANAAKPDDLVMVHARSAQQIAADQEVEDARALGGLGGVIVMGAEGRPAFAMTTSGMYRGAVSADAPPTVAIYGDE